jgi:MerR family transcriptional regulator, copper efflux regulator
MATLTIGKVARAAGVGIETVRFYERSGLLEPPPRTAAGYRQYPPEAVDRLGFIRRAQRLGFTLTEVAELLALHEGPVLCEDVKVRAAAKVAAIDEKVAALLAVKTELLALIQRCDVVCTTSCTVLLAPGPCGGGDGRQS